MTASLWRLSTAIIVALCCVALYPVVTASPVRAACPEPFSPDLPTRLAADYPGRTFTAEVYDQRTGCVASLLRDERITTASVFKVEVMAAVLLRAQEEGRALTTAERALITPMISESANPPATQLFLDLGGSEGFAAVHQAFGLDETSPSPPTWGLTVTSAHDQVELLRQVLLGEYGPLQSSGQDETWGFMTAVVPSQQWGITAGVNERWVVAQKNGFAAKTGEGWRINSVGVVEDLQGGRYVLAVLSTGWASQAEGIAGIESVVRDVSAALAPLGAPPLVPFVDVGENEWFYPAVVWAHESGVTKGTSPLTFDPLAPVTRGQAAAFLNRALDLEAVAAPAPFVDTIDSLFAEDIAAVAAAGITLGCNPPDSDRYCPDSEMTRGQLAAMLVRALALAPAADDGRFTDDDGSIFEDDIARLAAAGLLVGCNPPVNDRSCPEATLTRAQTVTFLQRADDG